MAIIKLNIVVLECIYFGTEGVCEKLLESLVFCGWLVEVAFCIYFGTEGVRCDPEEAGRARLGRPRTRSRSFHTTRISPPGLVFQLWLVADGWCRFVLREKCYWLVAGG
jgi:hypothetical protein